MRIHRLAYVARQRAFRLRIHSQAELRLTKLTGPQLAGYPLDDRRTTFRRLGGTGDPGRSETWRSQAERSGWGRQAEFHSLKSSPHVVLQQILVTGMGADWPEW
jgi:hypothetical protein